MMFLSLFEWLPNRGKVTSLTLHIRPDLSLNRCPLKRGKATSSTKSVRLRQIMRSPRRHAGGSESAADSLYCRLKTTNCLPGEDTQTLSPN